VRLPHVLQRIERSAPEKGQALVEFSFSLILLIIIMSGILDLGRLYYMWVSLEDGAGEAALYLSINPDCRTAPAVGSPLYPRCNDPNNAYYRAENSGGGMVDWTGADITMCIRAYGVVECYSDWAPGTATIGDSVQVTIRYQFEPVTPFIIRMLEGRELWMTVEASQIIVSEGQME